MNKTLIPLVVLTALMVSCATAGDILPRKNRKYFEEHNWDFESLAASKIDDYGTFENHIRYYVMDAEPEEAWDSYLASDPARQWTGPIANFAALYDPSDARLYTVDDNTIPQFEEGQTLFLDLHIESLLHIPVGFKIATVDQNRHVFVFKYLEENASHGMQEVSFYTLTNGDDSHVATLIRHRSWFRSGSSFRDRVFYKPYHEKSIDEYHFGVADDSGYHLSITSPRKLRRNGFVPEGLAL